ncbi:hypothetical protein Ab1vBOLIVR2_gp03 [Agrobacterium phage OLIVR2]|uniref:Uncharacterized protein n=1 Tax=Agrobacterium phage OLIVR1 TaxID=2723769 RepID=A0A858MRN3_9CAUD|nr:hypothetical protein [Xanthomonas campestris]YP_010107037.1 hypothetical protein KNU98_gp106 [Agrobacterium phage OLIVR1]QIW87306.1 hypothetical protein Ab1vBOLIVR2_gp03 [Agrobacterium phage OLIVR2]QIW87413.1 hypothetical protein Ab1vBOLIVR3_gp03 [Agrobacterium phage OLIVR3]MCF8861609.1 hypothetical protein [Xanthomonas campestris pv. campestris]QIW87198.1 hypothetical protein Ab1vBOLIVR1_gp03 [Agrobacterium phage OLIVR1]
MLMYLVQEAWLRAKENGYEEELRMLPAFQLAIALRDKDSDIGQYSLEKVLPTVIDFINNGYK